MYNNIIVVSFPDPALEERKGSGIHQTLFGVAQDAACRDCYDDNSTLFGHGNASTTLTRGNSCDSMVSHDNHM